MLQKHTVHELGLLAFILILAITVVALVLIAPSDGKEKDNIFTCFE